MLVLPCLYQLLSTVKLHLWPLPDFSQTCFPGTGALSGWSCRCRCARPRAGDAAGWAQCPSGRAARGALPVSVPQHRSSLPAGPGAGEGMGAATTLPGEGRGCPRAAPQPGARSSAGTAQPTGRGMLLKGQFFQYSSNLEYEYYFESVIFHNSHRVTTVSDCSFSFCLCLCITL